MRQTGKGLIKRTHKSDSSPGPKENLILSRSRVRDGDVADWINAIGGLCDSESVRQSPFFLMRNGVILSESHRLDTVNARREQFLPRTLAPHRTNLSPRQLAARHRAIQNVPSPLCS